jgi:hypothetical protein
MKLGHSKRQKTAKRSRELRQAVRDNSWDLSDRVLLELTPASNEACTVDVALREKPYELPSPTIWSAKNSFIYRLLSNLKSGLTVKLRMGLPRNFYRQIYRQNHSLGSDRCRYTAIPDL